MAAGEVGKYKVAYVGDNPRVLSSDMFDSYTAATTFAKTKNLRNYLLFEYKSNKAGHYEWYLLDEGSYFLYRAMLFLKENWLVILILISIALVFFFFNKWGKEAMSSPGSTFAPSAPAVPAPSPTTV